MDSEADPAVAEATEVLTDPSAGSVAIRGGALRGVAYGLGAAVGLAWVPFVIRDLGVAEFGRYAVALSVASLFGSLLEGGFASIAVREYSVRSGPDRERFFANLLGLRLAISVLAIGLSILFSVVVGYPSRVVFATGLAAVMIALTSTQVLLGAALTGQLRFGAAASADVLRQLAQAAIIALLLVNGSNVTGYVASSLPAAAMSLALVAWLVRRSVPLLPRLDAHVWQLMLREAVAFSAASAIYSVYFRVVIIALSLLSTPLQTGLFATAYRVVELLLAIPNLLISAVFPVLSRAARDEPLRLTYGSQRTLEVSALLGLGSALGLSALAPALIQLLGGRAAHGSIVALQISSVALGTTFLAVGCGFALLALRRHRALLAAAVAALLTSVVASGVLVPIDGARGGAVASVLAEVALAGTCLYMLRRGSRGAMPRIRVIAAIGLAAGCSVPVLILAPVASVPATALVVFVYGAVAGILGGVPREAVESLAHVVKLSRLGSRPRAAR